MGIEQVKCELCDNITDGDCWNVNGGIIITSRYTHSSKYYCSRCSKDLGGATSMAELHQITPSGARPVIGGIPYQSIGDDVMLLFSSPVMMIPLSKVINITWNASTKVYTIRTVGLYEYKASV